MTIKIQKILYDLISSNVRDYRLLAYQTDDLPYLLLDQITLEPLPYSCESRRYEEITAVIRLFEEKNATKKGLKALEQISNLVRRLSTTYPSIKNLSTSITTRADKEYYEGEIQLNFTHITDNNFVL